MEMQVYSPEDLTNYEGEQYAFEDDGIGFEDGEYTGFGDDHVDFGGDKLSFASELASHRAFTVVVVNANGVTERVGFGAALAAIAGSTQLSEGVVKAGVTVTGQPTSYDIFKKFIDKNPTRLVALKIQSSNETQLGMSLIITHISPFENLGSKPISLSSFTSEGSFNNKMLTLKNLNLQLDNQTDISIDIPAGATTTFTLYCGGVYNAAKALNSKASRAKRSRKVAASKV